MKGSRLVVVMAAETAAETAEVAMEVAMVEVETVAAMVAAVAAAMVVDSAAVAAIAKTTKTVGRAHDDKEKGWYELLKTKGVGDSEYHKITPDNGEAVVFEL